MNLNITQKYYKKFLGIVTGDDVDLEKSIGQFEEIGNCLKFDSKLFIVSFKESSCSLKNQALVCKFKNPKYAFFKIKDFKAVEELINLIKIEKFNASITLTDSLTSPYCLAYICYMAGIPIRIGKSLEFGGTIVSTLIANNMADKDYCIELLKMIYFSE